MWPIRAWFSAINDFITALDWLMRATVWILLGVGGGAGVAMQMVAANFGASPLETIAYGLAAACLAILVVITGRLFYLNAPSVSIEIDGVEDDMRAKTQTLYLKITGLSVSEVRPQVFVARADSDSTVDGTCELHRPVGAPPPFGVTRREPHHLAALIYREDRMSLHFFIPCKIPVSNVMRGNEFLVLIHAYGGPSAAELEFRTGIDDGTLWVQQTGAKERLMSPIRALAHELFKEKSP